MRIDLRYPIVVAAFFVPTPALKLILWIWDVDVTAPDIGAVFSIALGCAAYIAAMLTMFGYDSKPIWWPKGADE